MPKAAADEIADKISQGSGAGETPQHIGGALGKVEEQVPESGANSSS